MTTPCTPHGADISHWQSGTLNLAAAKKAGLKWLAHKATQGTNYVDPNYSKRRSQAKTARLPWLGYGYAVSAGTAKAQAQFFLKNATPKAGDLRSALDFEDKSLASWSVERKTDFVGQWTETVKAEIGAPPFVYLPGTWRLSQTFDCPLWVPRYSNTNAAPRIPAPWKTWTIWQFTNGVYGVPRGIAGLGNVDMDTLNMDPADFLAAFTIGGAKPAPAPKPAPVVVKKPTPAPAPKPEPVAHVKAKASVLMGVDTNINLRGKDERDYYATTFPDLHLCWDVRMPAANTHGVSGVIDAMLGHGVTFTRPRVIVTGKPACLDHRPIKDTAWIGGKKVRVVWQSLNDKRNADKTWQAPASAIVPWLVHLASTADILWTDEALMPNIRKDLAAALGNDWTVLRAGEYMVATRNSVATPTAKGVESILSHVPGLAGWRQDHWGDFEYDIDGHPLLIVGNHAPSAVANLTKAGAPKQVAAHESGDKALNGKVRAWLVSKGEPVKAL